MRTRPDAGRPRARRASFDSAPRWCVAAVAALACADAGATAFFVNQQSVKGLGRVDAGNSAAADELGTIFFNPAGLTLMWDDAGRGDRDSAASVAVNVIRPRSTQTNTGSTLAYPLNVPPVPAFPYAGGNGHDPTAATPVPNSYFAHRIDPNNAVGVGINVPFGLSARFDPNWYGRYDATEASLRTINLSLVGAHRSGPWSLGGGLDVQYARTTLEQALPNGLAPDARAYTHGDAYTPGFNVGAIYSFNQDDRVGVHYRSGMKHHIKGTADTSGFVGPLAAYNGITDARADLKLPAIATAGARIRLSPSLVGLGEFAWYDWSTFDEVRVRLANGLPDVVRPSHYKDAYGVSVGLEYREGAAPLTWRGGVHYDTTPTVDAYRDVTVPDANRLWLGIGATWRPAASFELDVAFTHVFFRDTTINVTRDFGYAVANVRGDVSTSVETLAFDLRWRF